MILIRFLNYAEILQTLRTYLIINFIEYEILQTFSFVAICNPN